MDLVALPTDMQSFSVHELLQDLDASLDLSRVSNRVPASLTLRSDYQYVRIIVLNLLTNAVKYSLPGTSISLDVRERTGYPDQATLIVENEVAPGGAPDPQRLFDRYYRSESARGKAGAGLGLWLSRSLAQRLGGDILYRQQGSTLIFEVNLERA